MLPGLDSRPPTDAQVAAAKAQGYRVWGLYHGIPGDGIAPDHLASDDDFRRVKAAGFAVLAYVSGNEDPAAIKAWSQAQGVPTAVDCERFIRDDGPWVPGWLAASGSGLYGNGSVHYDASGFRKAASHIFAGYYGYDPKATWPSWLPRDASPAAWQFQGTTTLFGMAVDLSWFDDSFAQFFGPGQGFLEDDMPRFIRNLGPTPLGAIDEKGPTGKRHLGMIEWEWEASRGATYIEINQIQWDAIPDAPGTAFALSAADEQLLKEAHDSIANLAGAPPSAAGLSAAQAQQLQEAHDAVMKLTIAGTLTPTQDNNLQAAKDAISRIESSLKGA